MSLERLIAIESPKDGDASGFILNVRGRVFPGESLVQVLVQSADGQWYTQRRAQVNGNRWECDVRVAYEDRHNANEYVIAAGVGGARILDSRIANLGAEGALWTTQFVRRED